LIVVVVEKIVGEIQAFKTRLADVVITGFGVGNPPE
jgi:hypothetical protein